MPCGTSRIQNAAGLNICHLSQGGLERLRSFGVGPGCVSGLKRLLFAGARLSGLTDNVHARGPQDQVSERARRVGQATCTVYVNLAAAAGEAVSYYCITRRGRAD